MQHETKQKLKEILSKTGHVLAVEDFDDIAALDALAQKISDPGAGIDSALTEHAVFVKGCPVYPITLAHLQYIDESRGLFDGTDVDSDIIALWVTTIEVIGRDHYDMMYARRCLKRWARHSRWTPEDIRLVMQLRYGRLNGSKDTDGPPDTGALLAMLVREYGGTPDYWMREASIGVIEALIADWQRQQNAQASAYNRTAGRGKAVAPAPTPKYETVKRFRQYADSMEKRWQKNP